MGSEGRPLTGRRLLRIAAWALALGLLVALPVGGRQRVSVELWFTALALWLLIGLAVSLIRAAPPRGGRSAGLLPVLARWFARLRRRSAPESPQLKDHLYIEALIRRATVNERSHSRRLRPRLQAIVDYQFLLQYGIDSNTDSTQAIALQQQRFGDTAWLLDPTVTDRAPTLDELDRFLRRLNDDGDHQ
jgi:hypothetical protein